MSDSMTAPVLVPTTNDGDHDLFAHIAPKHLITEAYVMGTPVTALCGKTWVPSRDPKNYPVCATCREMFDQMPKGL